MESVKMEQLSLKDCVTQFKVNVPDMPSKIELLVDRIVLFGAKMRQMVIYVNTRDSAETLHEALFESEMEVSLIHGDLTQKNRDDSVRLFNKMINIVMVTTEDVPAQGIDLSRVNAVVNYDLPVVDDSTEEKEPDIHLYLQRFCSTGVVFNLLCGDTDKMIMDKIERRLNLAVAEVPSWKSYRDVRSAYTKAGLSVGSSP